MKKSFFVITALTFLILSSPASAGLIGSVTHNYGAGAGFNPGGNDVLQPSSVVVSEFSSQRFQDVFEFSAFSSVSALELVLDFENAGPSCPAGFCFLGEIWSARLLGSQPGSNSDDLFVVLEDSISPQSITISAATDTDDVSVWMQSLQEKALSLMFSEESIFFNEFKLNAATLNVYGEPDIRPNPDPVSVSEPPALALLGLGLAGFVATRRGRFTRPK